MAYFNKLERQTVLIKYIMLMLLSMKIQCGNKITKKFKISIKMQIFEKIKPQTIFSSAFGKLWPTIFFRHTLAFNISIYWCQRHLQKKLRSICQKLFAKFSKGGCLETQAEQKSLSFNFSGKNISVSYKNRLLAC